MLCFLRTRTTQRMWVRWSSVGAAIHLCTLFRTDGRPTRTFLNVDRKDFLLLLHPLRSLHALKRDLDLHKVAFCILLRFFRQLRSFRFFVLLLRPVRRRLTEEASKRAQMCPHFTSLLQTSFRSTCRVSIDAFFSSFLFCLQIFLRLFRRRRKSIRPKQTRYVFAREFSLPPFCVRNPFSYTGRSEKIPLIAISLSLFSIAGWLENDDDEKMNGKDSNLKKKKKLIQFSIFSVSGDIGLMRVVKKCEQKNLFFGLRNGGKKAEAALKIWLLFFLLRHGAS